MEIQLEILEFEWHSELADDPYDQCAHGRVNFAVNDVQFVSPSDSWTVSAAGLYLLRTFERSHTPENSVTCDNQLFPCCAFTAFPDEHDPDYEVLFIGCPLGKDPSIIHSEHGIIIRTEEGSEALVSPSEWTACVHSFADSVTDFYRRCAPKIEVDESDERLRWRIFWREWQTRRNTVCQPSPR